MDDKTVYIKFTSMEHEVPFVSVQKIKQDFFTGAMVIINFDGGKQIIPHGKYDYIVIGNDVAVTK